MITRNTYKWMTRKWKEQEVDEPARNTLIAEDRAHLRRYRLWPQEDIDSGVYVEFDDRSRKDVAGFPVGDSRRW